MLIYFLVYIKDSIHATFSSDQSQTQNDAEIILNYNFEDELSIIYDEHIDSLNILENFSSNNQNNTSEDFANRENLSNVTSSFPSINYKQSINGKIEYSEILEDIYEHEIKYTIKKIKEILIELSQSCCINFREPLLKFIKLLERTTLRYSLNPFEKLIHYSIEKGCTNSSIDHFLKEKRPKYRNYLYNFVNITFNEDYKEDFKLNQSNRLKNTISKGRIAKKNFKFFVNEITRLYIKFELHINTIITTNLETVGEDNSITVYVSRTGENIYVKIIEEIINWFYESEICFFCRSEIVFLRDNIFLYDKIDFHMVASQLLYLYFYTLKVISSYDILNDINSTGEYVKILENDSLAMDILFLKNLILKIISQSIKRKNLFIYYRITNFFIFLRLYFKSNQILFKDLDLFLIEENLTEEKIDEYIETEKLILFLSDYRSFDERQKKIFLVLLLKLAFQYNDCSKYDPILESIGYFVIKKE
ncbi:hypothetical protein H312_02749 [Anncaliia algerae PRA339]|uniref:Uncharacterized protein n=1 Tax=Anncaliia algerae PRA339 TaxID=1288291 RepID=A0A059EYQ5_9MICR|nr:hypothetical protein H312_02749 [Anncaliia algerae PRA339]